MRVAVCDDDRMSSERLKTLLDARKDISTSMFLRPEELLDSIERGKNFDLICMDIEWSEKRNGIDFALEAVKLSPLSQIIFITGYNDRFSQQIFLKPVNLCGYLVKPIDDKVLEQLLVKAK